MEVLADVAYGCLVTAGDAAALAAAISAAIDEEPEGERRRARALEFSVEVGGDRYLELMGLE